MTDILAFGAHPDDIEFGCGGILAKMSAGGAKIVMVDLTCGEKGTHGTSSQRVAEARNAASLIKAQRIQLDFIDCEIIDTYENRLKLVKVIRQFRPKLVLGPMWKGEQNHPDHIACGLMLRYACRLARFQKILPELPLHWVEGILHYLPLVHAEPDFIIDISDFVNEWIEMMKAHQSQLNTFDYVDWNLRNASQMGLIIDRPYAQGLVKGNPLLIDDLMTIAKGIREI